MIVRGAMIIFQRLEVERKMHGNIVSPTGGEGFDFGGFGVRWKIAGADSDQRFAIVHHPIAARTLAAPLHRHHREDEYSYIVRGTIGALLGDEVVVAKQGDWVFKPRKQWHTFWNPADEPCEIIEVISPAGFENYFREFSQVWPDRAAAASIREKYELDMDVESVSGLCERFNLQLP